MVLYEDKFITFTYNEKYRYITERYYLESQFLTDEHMRTLMYKLRGWFQELKPLGYLSCSRDFRFTVDPQMQDFLNNEIAPAATVMRYIARVYSTDILSQLGMEQFVENNLPDQINTCFFDDDEKAQTWLEAKMQQMIDGIK
jgi:hypothetical protein